MDFEFDLYNKTDEELVKEAKSNEKAYGVLAKRYETIIKGISSNFFINGTEKCDLHQEALIGLYNAVQNYDEAQDIKFKTFATMCIKRKLITSLKHSTRKKNEFFNNSLSLDAVFFNDNDNDNDNDLKDIIPDVASKDPCSLLVEKEYNSQIRSAIYEKLSERERLVLDEYVKGKTYMDIANSLNLNEKSVDTALTRIRRKANAVKEEYN